MWLAMRQHKKLTVTKPLHEYRSATTNPKRKRRNRQSKKAFYEKKQIRGDVTPHVSSKKVKASPNKQDKNQPKLHVRERHGESYKTIDIRYETPMDEELKLFVDRVTLSPQEKQLRKSVFEDVRNVISSAFQDATVQLYGSSSTGLDTFRSDLDITVGNITLSSSQPLPTVVLLDKKEGEDKGFVEAERQREEVSRIKLNESIPVQVEEEETSFSLNLALSIGTASSVDSANISRRVQPKATSHWNPTLRRRKIRVLRTLQTLFKSQRPHFRVKCLHKAKIPILMVLDTKTNLAIDIGFNREMFEASEHGRSTSLVIKLQETLGAPFTILVIFLKEFLHQFKLDKPFTGGIGSFRLYMMVAYVFQRCGSKYENKPHQPVSSLLLAFFELFGNKKLPNFFRKDTQLPLPFGNNGYLDFGGVFRIQDCVETFAMTFDILSSTKSIGSIIYEDHILKDR